MTHPPGTFSKFPGIVSKREPIGPEGPPSCLECNGTLKFSEPCEDAKGNPICDDCWDRIQEKEGDRGA